jgi:hypothetical protein
LSQVERQYSQKQRHFPNHPLLSAMFPSYQCY